MTNKQKELVAQHVKVVPFVLWRSFSKWRGTTLEDELLSAGGEALVRCVESYNPAKADFRLHATIAVYRGMKVALGRKDVVRTISVHESKNGMKSAPTYSLEALKDNPGRRSWEPEVKSHEDDVIMQVDVGRAVAALPKKHKSTVKQRFGIGCKERVLEVIGKRKGLSRERVRQVQEEALCFMKEFLRHGCAEIVPYSVLEKRRKDARKVT